MITYKDNVNGFETITVETGGVALDDGGSYVLLINSNAGPIRNDLGAVQASGGDNDAYADGYFVCFHENRGTSAADFTRRWYTDPTGGRSAISHFAWCSASGPRMRHRWP